MIQRTKTKAIVRAAADKMRVLRPEFMKNKNPNAMSAEIIAQTRLALGVLFVNNIVGINDLNLLRNGVDNC